MYSFLFLRNVRARCTALLHTILRYDTQDFVLMQSSTEDVSKILRVNDTFNKIQPLWNQLSHAVSIMKKRRTNTSIVVLRLEHVVKGLPMNEHYCAELQLVFDSEYFADRWSSIFFNCAQ